MSNEYERTLEWQDPYKPLKDAVVSVSEAIEEKVEDGKALLRRLSNAAQRAVECSQAIAQQVQRARIAAGMALDYVGAHKVEIARTIGTSIKKNAPATMAGAGTKLAVEAGFGLMGFGAHAVPVVGIAAAAGGAVRSVVKEEARLHRGEDKGLERFYAYHVNAYTEGKQKSTAQVQEGGIKGLFGRVRSAATEASNRLEIEAVNKAFKAGQRVEAARILDSETRNQSTQEVFSAYVERARRLGGTQNEIFKRAATLMRRDLSEMAMAHLVAKDKKLKGRQIAGNIEAEANSRAAFNRLSEAYRLLPEELQGQALRSVRDARKSAGREAITLLAGVRGLKSGARYFSGVGLVEFIGKPLGLVHKVKEHVETIVETPTGADGSQMIADRVLAKMPDTLTGEKVLSTEFASIPGVGDKTASIAVDFNPENTGGVIFEDKRTITAGIARTVAERATIPVTLASLKLHDMGDLMHAAQIEPRVNNLLLQTVKVIKGPDGTNITVGDVLMSMSTGERQKLLEEMSLAKVITDSNSRSEFMAVIKEVMTPKTLNVEIGTKGVGTLWHALEAGGIDPLQDGSAETFIKNVLPNLKVTDEVRKALVDSYNSSHPLTFAQLADQNQEIFQGTRGLGNVWNGEQVGITIKPEIEAGSFQQAVRASSTQERALDYSTLDGKTAMLANDFFRSQPNLSPNFTPLADDPEPGQPKTEWVRELRNGRWQLVPKTTIGSSDTVVATPEPTTVLSGAPITSNPALESTNITVVPAAGTQYETQWVKVLEKGKWTLKPIQVPIVRAGAPEIVVNQPQVVVASPSNEYIASAEREELERAAALAAREKAVRVEVTATTVPVAKATPALETPPKPNYVEGKFGEIDFTASTGSRIIIRTENKAAQDLFGFKNNAYETQAWTESFKAPEYDQANYVYDRDGGVIGIVHSGNTQGGGSPQFAEGARDDIQGGFLGNPRVSDIQVDQRLHLLEEQKPTITINQNGKKVVLELYDTMKASYQDVVNGNVEGQPWSTIGDGPDTIAFYFCGWGHIRAFEMLNSWEADFPVEIQKSLNIIRTTNDGYMVEAQVNKIMGWLKANNPARYDQFRWWYDRYGKSDSEVNDLINNPTKYGKTADYINQVFGSAYKDYYSYVRYVLKFKVKK